MNLKGRHFLTLKDYSQEEITYLLDLAAEFKDKKKQGICVDTLRGKNIALIFEISSTRTRCAFEVAAHDLGMGQHLSGTRPAPRSARRRASPTQPGCWAACTMESSTGASGRRSWRS